MLRAIAITAVLALVANASGNAAEPVDYLKQVKPLLRARCFACHGALRQKARLRLDTAALIRKGGKNGPAVMPGDSASSLLLDAVRGSNGVNRMPPRGEGEALSDEQIAVLRAWIDQGAKAPDEPVPPDPRKHWAFQAPVRPAVPRVANAAWVRNPIDAFIAAEHQKHRLQPLPEASKSVLLRRVYLDLIGLPPTRDELHAFLADPAPNAYEKVVDQLLASPHHGERWGRHWMDVWRYSDWYGRRAVPDVWNSAPQIWRWRDWIVQSLNADKGYDQMIREMLAGDEIAPDDAATVVATGYLVRNWYALNYNQWMRDTVEHTGKAFLGLTFNCAHCHDHKYDPISQEEYFRFRAFFEPLELRQDRVPGEPDPGPFQKYNYTKLRKVVPFGAIRVFDERPNAPTFMYVVGDERNRMPGKPPVTPGAPAFLGGDNLAIQPIELPTTAFYPGLQPFVQREEIARHEQALAEARSALERARDTLAGARTQFAEIERLSAAQQQEPRVIDMRTRAVAAVRSAQAVLALAEARLPVAEARLRAIQARIAADNAKYQPGAGDADDLARAASKAERTAARDSARENLVQAEQALAAVREQARGTTSKAVTQAEQQLAVAKKTLDAAEKAVTGHSTVYTPLSPIYPRTSTGRRRALAEWIAGRDNPLTARVAVNHLWMRHLDRPLVESIYDFGTNGKPPSHPALLDWLAVELMEARWSMKHLHRLIVTSNTYRMQSSSATDDANRTLDPDNHWLWHAQPRRMEAEVVRDSILHAAGELDRTLGGPPLENLPDSPSHRRSLYFTIHPEGNGRMKFLELFDAPDPCECYRRTASILPQQALALTNSRLLLNESRLLARKLAQTVREEPAFITAAFEQVLSRRPTQREQTLCSEFLRKQTALFRGVKEVPVKGDADVPPAAEPEQRAREGLLRVLFSHDDFVTIR